MRIPVVAGWIERRVLLNYRVDGDVLAALLPPPLRPRLLRGHGIAGISLVRLRQVRPRPLPALIGVASENAAHHIAVEWDGPDGVCEGVFVPRRDTSSPFNLLAGGRLFPGLQRGSRFQVREWADGLSLSVSSRDGRTRIAVRAAVAPALEAGSVFTSGGEAAEFFRRGALYDGIAARAEAPELRTAGWRVEALRPDLVESTFFDDRARFPEGTIAFDSALLMRSVPHERQVRHAAAVQPRLSPT
jgi:hypothetical protein